MQLKLIQEFGPEHLPWAGQLLDNATDSQLGVWADWLEEQGWDTGEGVRWLIDNNRRPDEYPRVFKEFSWFGYDGQSDMLSVLPMSVWRRLWRATQNPFHATVTSANYIYDPLRGLEVDPGRTWAHYTAFVDAAEAWLRRKEPLPKWPGGQQTRQQFYLVREPQYYL